MLNKKQNYFLAGVVGIVAKVAIIFGYFSVLNAFGVFPAKAVATLQKFLDEYIKNTEIKIDYIHGIEAKIRLCLQ